MFKIGDVIGYGVQGICKIDCIESKLIGKQTVDYYVLKPLFNENTTVFVPVNNEQLTAKIQNVVTKCQVEKLVQKAKNIDTIKTSNENQKRELYKEILSSGNHEKIIALIKTIRIERDSRRQIGKKLNINDEQTLRKAELLLYNEFGFVLGVAPAEVENIIEF